MGCYSIPKTAALAVFTGAVFPGPLVFKYIQQHSMQGKGCITKWTLQFASAVPAI